MFKRVLIANRGEIAVRIIRACRELGISPVAVYSQADCESLHVRIADEAIDIGPAPAEQSYLEINKIVAAAVKSGVEAIHPGYGFLSENAQFARAVQDAGLVFIGPPPEAIDLMGNKAQARLWMQTCGVPVIPGYQGDDDMETLKQKAGEIGYPVLVKAAAGGGGKGMRVVSEPADVEEGLTDARREAERSFGNGQLILERYIPHARHIEFQILADKHGNTLHLFDRECSIQRRHQKIIEETPSPFLDASLRMKMGSAAVIAAQSVGYQNAGTIEFIVDPDRREFYFLEMNTRLQVEHPVTELVTGHDLVHWQFRIASGERLPFAQEDLTQRGHAIECRLYAEDPANNFLPATGHLLQYIEPKGPGVRVDSGFSVGGELTIHYDPLIAKIIVWGEDRAAAISRMQSALRDTVLLGITHNGQFLQDVIAASEFAAGELYTTWVEERFGEWQPPQCNLPLEVMAAAALIQYQAAPSRDHGVNDQTGCDPYSPWKAANTFRVNE